MDPSERQSKTIVAAALIVRGAVEAPSLPDDDHGSPHAAGVRLRLTDCLYRLLTTDDAYDTRD
jgi:hypothetical protein